MSIYISLIVIAFFGWLFWAVEVLNDKKTHKTFKESIKQVDILRKELILEQELNKDLTRVILKYPPCVHLSGEALDTAMDDWNSMLDVLESHYK